MKSTLTHHFDTNLERFERVLFMPELVDFLVAKTPGVRAIDTLELKDEGTTLHRKRRTHPNPPASLPAFARVVNPEMMQYVEDLTYDRTAHRATFVVVPNIPENWQAYFSASGSYQLSEDRGRVKRVLDFEVKIKVPILGGLGEKIIWKEVSRSLEDEAKAIQEFLASGQGR